MNRKDSGSPEVVRWLEDTRGGDAGARALLLRWSRAELRRMARRHLPEQLRGALQESDLVQEALIKVERGLSATLAQGAQQYRAWMRTILRRVGVDALRSSTPVTSTGLQGDQEERGLDQLVAYAPSPSSEAAAREQQEQLRHSMARLPAAQRQALELYLEDTAIVEIARQLGRTEASVASLVKRGLKFLRSGQR